MWRSALRSQRNRALTASRGRVPAEILKKHLDDIVLVDEGDIEAAIVMLLEIEKTILALAARGGISVLLVEQHVGFALRAAHGYHVLEAGRVTSTGGLRA